MAEAVVDPLEVVKVDDEHGQGRSRESRLLRRSARFPVSALGLPLHDRGKGLTQALFILDSGPNLKRSCRVPEPVHPMFEGKLPIASSTAVNPN